MHLATSGVTKPAAWHLEAVVRRPMQHLFVVSTTRLFRISTRRPVTYRVNKYVALRGACRSCVGTLGTADVEGVLDQQAVGSGGWGFMVADRLVSTNTAHLPPRTGL